MNDIVVLDGRDFLIIKKVCIENNNFMYVVATDGSNDFTVLNEYNNNGTMFVKSVTDENIINLVFNKIIEGIN